VLRKPTESQLTALNSNEFISTVRSFNACALPFLNMSHLLVTRYGDLLLTEITAIGNNARMYCTGGAASFPYLLFLVARRQWKLVARLELTITIDNLAVQSATS
jgi:hypothetical protein